MGTQVSIQLFTQSQDKANYLFKLAMDEFHRIDRMMSPYKTSSEVSKVNQLAQKTEVEIPSDLFKVIQRSLHFSQLTNGAFDITFASAGFKYDYRERKKPNASELTKAVKAIDYRNIQLNKEKKNIRLKGADTVIDLGGIAKGYAVDQVVHLLAQEGVSSGLVTAGGDTRVIGTKQGQPWLVGIKHPRGEGHVITMPLAEVSISTSGDYERFFIEDGVRYHHILNPKTGSSVGELISASIIADDSLTADALSTSVFVMGVKAGIELIESLPGISCVLIDRTGKVHYSSDLTGHN